MDKEGFTESLLALTAERDIVFSRQQALMCHEHIRLMLEWNRHINLTRIIDSRDILIRHLLDSLVPACRLPRKGLAVDVGSGAGFPGIPLKILHPELDMSLLEAHGKKVSFLKVLVAGLPLGNISAFQGRWEELLRGDHPLAQRHYDIITMRALRLEPDLLTRLASQVLQPGGIFAWWAGPGAEDNPGIDKLAKETGMISQEAFSYILPGTLNPRRLLTWQKES
jgi:16S rRNA (guanine527-N7)-methyltransferase